MSKRILEYESEKVLPDSLIEIIEECERRIMINKHEPDKQFLHLSNMKYEFVKFFANFSKEVKE